MTLYYNKNVPGSTPRACISEKRHLLPAMERRKGVQAAPSPLNPTTAKVLFPIRLLLRVPNTHGVFQTKNSVEERLRSAVISIGIATESTSRTKGVGRPRILLIPNNVSAADISGFVASYVEYQVHPPLQAQLCNSNTNASILLINTFPGWTELTANGCLSTVV